MDVLFFDVNLTGVKRYPDKIAAGLDADYPHLRTGAMYLIKDGDGTYSGALGDVRHVPRALGSFIEKADPKVVVAFSHRIPDLIVFGTCRKLGVPTVLVQHGLFLEHMPYIGKAYVSRKAAYYARLLPELKSVTRASWGRLRRPGTLPPEGWRADKALVYGTGWIDFFNRQYGYSQDACEIVGYPDFDGWEAGQAEKGICYIAQTAVEDNRLPKRDFERFVAVLRQVQERFGSLVVKLHPRSDEALYRPLVEVGVNLIRHGEMPSRTVYIGHSSSLLAKAARVSRNIILWPFPSIPIPHYFESLAAAKCSDPNDLLDRIEASLDAFYEPDREYLSEIDRYFTMNPTGTIPAMARAIAELVS